MNNKYPVPTAQVAARVVEGQAVIILADSGEVNVLNQVGTRIWEMVDGKHTVDAITATIVREFDVPLETARHDVEEFIQGLVTGEVITLQDSPGGDQRRS
jgi:hypothetical protein